MKTISSRPVIVVLFLLFSIAFARPAKPVVAFRNPPKPQFVETKKQITAYVDTIMRKYTVPGAMVGIWKNDTTVIELFQGVADATSGRPMSRVDQFRIGSITKTFVSSAFLELCDEGKVSLDDTVKKFLPMVPGADKITLRELCGHRSGIHDMIEDTAGERNEYSFVKNPKKHWAKSDIMNCVVSSHLDFEPGSRFNYSNTGYLLLGLVVENVANATLDKVIRERFIIPQRLSSTAIPSDSLFPKQFCRGYMTAQEPGQLVDVTSIDPSLVWSAGSMISTFDDLKKWTMVFGEGAFLKPETKMKRDAFSAAWNESTGYGLGIMKLAGFIGHSGGIFGYNTGMFYNPERKIAVVVVLNNCNYVEGHMSEVITGISKVLGETLK